MRHSLALLTSALILASAVTSAAGGPDVRVTRRPDGAGLLVAGRLVAIFRKPNGSLSPSGRASLAAERLRTLLAQGADPAGVEARPRGEDWAVYVGGTLVMVATREEAAARREEPSDTARRWAANLRQAIPRARSGASGERHPVAGAAARPRPAQAPKEPPLSLGSEPLSLPVGETRVVPVRGGGEGPLTASSDASGVATAALVEGRPAVSLTGISPGKATITVVRGEKIAQLTVWVKKLAGRIRTETPLIQVTGSAVPPSLVRRLAAARVLDAVEREPGASVRVESPLPGLRPLGRGESVELRFPVAITGAGYLPVRAEAPVRVENTVLPRDSVRRLLYSNDPESVRECQTLFRGLVESDAPARLLYHHQNRTGRPFLFQLHLVNAGDSPAEAHVIEGEAGPFIDPVQVGHRAGQRYMAALLDEVGFIVSVPARSSRLIYMTSVPDPETVSGIYNFRILEGGPLIVQVIAATEVVAPAASDLALQAARAQPHTYHTPQKDETYRYTVGGRWAFVPMGRKAIVARNDQKKLFGNYGVIYNVTVEVTNPTDEMRTIRVVLSPEAGWARGVFVIEGKLVEAPQIHPPQEAVLWTGPLGPGQTKTLSIQGIPVGGSSYPVSIVVRS